eukprot:CAMPEP_0179147266 /NCGR_PEP_ID=MMETSP0796-20121207/71181_1 /TAXON_ID=73915 /ORGANISM="Pyrodinium bahamense, Strain pbaha01" /LENGTH=66 /DNA_ID=CAMNT_0020847851 /DNA_START=58 /DNA_END=255 /DNA_ORIENTATION=-
MTRGTHSPSRPRATAAFVVRAVHQVVQHAEGLQEGVDVLGRAQERPSVVGPDRRDLLALRAVAQAV